MLLVSELVKWWYTAGLRGRVKKANLSLGGTIDYFSMDLLLKTLFQPYKQISAGRVDGSLQVKMSALLEKVISRVIGGMIRIILLIIACITIVLQVVLAFVLVIAWLVVPILPIVGLVLTIKGVAL